MMRSVRTPPARQRGVALIMAVLIVALATILAISVASEGYMDQRRTSTVIATDQAYELGLGAEAAAAKLLQADHGKTDSPDQAWAQPYTFPADEASVKIQGEDLQGRFNLNNLMDQSGNRNDSGVRQFQRLLDLLGIDMKFATLTLDWIDANSNPEFPDGAEDSTYAGQTPAYLAANMPITRTSELMSIVGMKQEDYIKLEPYIAALPIDTPLNVCTAPALVLDSLNTTILQYSRDPVSFASSRSGGCFPTINDVKTSFNGDSDFKKLLADHPNYLAETTGYFRANILVTLGTTELALYSVLNRTGTGATAKTYVIQRSFGTT